MSNYDSALEAFQNSLPSEEGSENQPTPEAAPVEGTPAPEQGQPSREIDVSGLPEEAQIFLRAREREMQADYTRKTQEVAQQRQEAENAMRFIQSLNSDPDFAYQTLQYLNSQLEAAGYQVAPEPTEYEYDEYGEPQGPDPYAQELAEIRGWKEQMEQEWREASLAAQLDRELATIQSQHPDWSEGDLQNIVDLGFSTNGDLLKAAQQYEALQDQILSRYLERKGSVNTPAPLPNQAGTPAPHQPKGEAELRSAAMEIIRANLPS